MSDKHCDSNDQVGCEADGKEDVDTQKGDASRPRFAKRRPNWEPQKLHHDLKLAPFDELKAQTRKPCPVCGRSRCWYCPDCLCSLCPDEQPVLKLPFKIRIITHPEEKRSKSTGLHAKLLCPEYVELIDFDHVEAENLSPASTALLFPSTEAIRPQELSLSGIDTVYIIDSRWKKAKGLVTRPEYAKMQHVRLTGDLKSSFWRFHTRGVEDDGLCSIEALYFLLKQLQQNEGLAEEFRSPHSFDNLLWFFALQHEVVSKKFQNRKKARTQ